MDKNNDIIQQAIDDRIDAFIRGLRKRKLPLSRKSRLTLISELMY